MAEENRNHYETSETRDVTDRGVFDFLGNKKDSHDNKPQEEHIATDFDHKVKLSDDHPQHDEGEKKHSLLEKLHRSDSSSSSSSEEEVEEDGKKIRKKKEKKGKGLKEKLEEKIGHKKEEEHHIESSGAVPVDKIKEKLPGGATKKPEEHTAATTTHPPAEYAETTPHHEHEAQAQAQAHGEAKEKKGILEKIKEKLPGYHPKSEEDKEKEKEKEKEKQSASH
ncbi:hypothetical protein PIB30_003016 [Stylosanthes scabra]|uniref:Dehydrin n=1 Tax=Stylosanthes scabra TaxID=79078 RepID=A0ABU6W1C8_9FABA|nr:hypothetical protein [Stylosanthes scabra]